LNFGSEKETPNTVLVWGGISSCHPNASLCRVTGKFDSKSYNNIIKEHILPFSKNESTIGLVHDWYYLTFI
jgi:hypothetical protein